MLGRGGGGTKAYASSLILQLLNCLWGLETVDLSAKNCGKLLGHSQGPSPYHYWQFFTRILGQTEVHICFLPMFEFHGKIVIHNL